MKKRYFCLFLISILLLFSFSGCVQIEHHYILTEKEIDRIAFFDLREINQTRVDPISITECQPCYILPSEQHDEFVESLSVIEFRNTIILFPAAVDPSFYYGDWTVGIYYTDGSARFISDMGWGQYYSDVATDSGRGNHADCKSEEWDKLIRKYVPQEIY